MRVIVTDAVLLEVPVTDAVLLGVPVPVSVAVTVLVPVPLAVMDSVMEGVIVSVGDTLPLPDSVPVLVRVAVATLAVVVALRVAVVVLVGSRVIEDVPVLLGLAPTVRDAVGVSVLAAVLLGVTVSLVLAVLEAVPV